MGVPFAGCIVFPLMHGSFLTALRAGHLGLLEASVVSVIVGDIRTSSVDVTRAEKWVGPSCRMCSAVWPAAGRGCLASYGRECSSWAERSIVRSAETCVLQSY